jgi:hypothetical protein
MRQRELQYFLENYNVLRRKLIQFFAARGRFDPQELADDTLFRLFQRLESGLPLPENDIEKYARGIAKHVNASKPETRTVEPSGDLTSRAPDPCRETFAKLQLARVLDSLKPQDRRVLLGALNGDGNAVAAEEHLTPEALRVRLHRIRKRLLRDFKDIAGDYFGSK